MGYAPPRAMGRLVLIFSVRLKGKFAAYVMFVSILDLDTRKPGIAVWGHQKCRPDCASTQSDKRLCYSLSEKYCYSSGCKQNYNIQARICS